MLVRDFEGIAERGTAIEDAVLEINLTHPRSRANRVGYCLAFDHGRVAVATVRALPSLYTSFELTPATQHQSAGLFIVTLDACTRRVLKHGPTPLAQDDAKGRVKAKTRATEAPSAAPMQDMPATADVAIAFLPRLSDRRLMADVSCVQMSATCLYLVYKASRIELQGGSYWGSGTGTTAYLWDGEPRYLDEISDVWTRRHTSTWHKLPTSEWLPINSRACSG